LNEKKLTIKGKVETKAGRSYISAPLSNDTDWQPWLHFTLESSIDYGFVGKLAFCFQIGERGTILFNTIVTRKSRFFPLISELSLQAIRAFKRLCYARCLNASSMEMMKGGGE